MLSGLYLRHFVGAIFSISFHLVYNILFFNEQKYRLEEYTMNPQEIPEGYRIIGYLSETHSQPKSREESLVHN